VEGIADVDEVCVSRDALEIVAAGKHLTFPFLDFARGREIATGRVPVGELHFSKSSYTNSHFVFYMTPRIVIFMPADEPTTYPNSHFWRVQAILRDGGFKLYEDGPPKLPPIVLDPRPARTIAYVMAALAFAWAYALAGFLPGMAGAVWRDHLLWNSGNPSISLAFMLPAIAIPITLALRHGRTARAVTMIIATSYVIAMLSQFAMRHVIHPWAAIEQPPFNRPFWSAHQFGSMLIVVVIAAIFGFTWRRAFLEPIARGSDAKTANK